MKNLDDCTLFELFENAKEIDDLEYLSEQLEDYLNHPENVELDRYIGGENFSYEEITEVDYGEIDIQTIKPGCGRGCCPDQRDETLIPISWFKDRAWETDVTAHFKQLSKQIKKEERAQKRLIRTNELRELKRLKEKYEK